MLGTKEVLVNLRKLKPYQTFWGGGPQHYEIRNQLQEENWKTQTCGGYPMGQWKKKSKRKSDLKTGRES